MIPDILFWLGVLLMVVPVADRIIKKMKLSLAERLHYENRPEELTDYGKILPFFFLMAAAVAKYIGY